MTQSKDNSLLALVQSFFRDYLGGIRGASAHTIRAYRDALKLFFLFLAHRKRRSIAELSLEDIQAELCSASWAMSKPNEGIPPRAGTVVSRLFAASSNTCSGTISHAPINTVASWLFPPNGRRFASSAF